VSRPAAYALLGAAAGLPRLAVVAVERGDILTAFTEKSDDFARTLVEHGTFGLIPGEPSAYTQPLYGWFLALVYWTADRHWLAVGLAQTAIAVGTCWLVYEIGRRALSERAGVVAALVATLNPYLIWHDVHVNREVLDTLLAAALVLATLAAAERRSLPPAALAGALTGLAILGNARLVLLPLLLLGYLAWRLGLGRQLAVAASLLVAACALVLTPWLVRNRVEVGCVALTTDARALWKANNESTYEVLRRGGWIDDVPRIPGSPYTPEEAAALYDQTDRLVHVDECGQMRYYRRLALDFMEDHPGEKAKLAIQAAAMLWDPRVTKTEGGAGAGGFQDTARTWIAPLYFLPLYALALLGVRRVPRELAVLAVSLLVYVTLAALVFAGATRYRASWDFLLALLAAPVLVRLLRR
jgi:hypothetical protein